MPYYEVTVTATRTICVKANDEEDAKDRACDEYMEWRTTEAEIEDEFDEVKDAEHIKDYKEQGELLTVNYGKGEAAERTQISRPEAGGKENENKN